MSDAKQSPSAAAPATLLPPEDSPYLPQTTSQQSSIEAARAAAEIQAQVVVAMRNPRNPTLAFLEITEACKRKSLAEEAMYAYPRGGQTVTGTTIKLALTIKQAWGNIASGYKEVERGDGFSRLRAFAWDLQKNTREEREIIVKHERKAGKDIVPLTDPRDIQEFNANQASRAERVCLEKVIPGYVFEEAQYLCEKTLAGDGSVPLIDRVRRMVAAFKELGVSQEMLELHLQHKIEATIPAEIVGLTKIHNSIRDGATKREEWFAFGPADAPPSAAAESLKERLAAKSKPREAAKEG